MDKAHILEEIRRTAFGQRFEDVHSFWAVFVRSSVTDSGMVLFSALTGEELERGPGF